jgi:maltooligosyltrehalose trehalohydrolase
LVDSQLNLIAESTNLESGRAHGPRGDWLPSIGAWPQGDGFQFRVWAPTESRVELVVAGDGAPLHRVALDAAGDGTHTTVVAGLPAGARYGYLLDGRGPFPDPASRWQPDGVHGLSATVDARSFAWADDAWRGIPLGQAIFYELHVGAFTPAGSFDGVRERLADLVDLGVTVVELMPLADFPGDRNWGYDGVSLFAPARAYGTPDDLRRLVDAAHRHGLAVILDVVYNHFGPDGAYGFTFSPYYASTRHASPWGAAVNFDGDESTHVRGFVVENALYWLHEYHFDGLRLDATHAIADDGPRHVLAELGGRVRLSLPHRTTLLVAEDDRNLASIVRPVDQGGWGLDAVWADDFHHHARRIVAGDHDGYYQDASDDARDLAATIRRGWFYTGQVSAYRGEPRGTDPSGVPPERMVTCLQNHDQVGNRAFGDRLHERIAPPVYRALTALLLTAPETPLLFMGQEWAATTPFLYFTDHNPELGRLVTIGRRNEFSRFEAFRDETTRSRIPDPQARETFEASRLRWEECGQPAHAAVRALYRALLSLRRTEPALASSMGADAAAPDADTVVIRRGERPGERLMVVARLRGAGTVDLAPFVDGAPPGRWAVALTTEDPVFRGPDDAGASFDPVIHPGPGRLVVQFLRPSAVILRES